MSHIEKSRVVWARADVASAQIRVIIEQANVAVDQRFERRQALANRCLVDLQMLAQMLRSIRTEAAAEAEAEGDLGSLDTPSILACHHGLGPLFQSVKSFDPLVAKFLSEHGAGLSNTDRDEIKNFVKWANGLERKLDKLRDERLNVLESDLERAGQEDDEANSDWDVTLADGLSDDHGTS
jgi:hypothetical protein